MANKKKKIEPQIEAEVETTDKIIKVNDDKCPKFTLEQLVNSNRYKKYAHLIEGKLDKTGTYTLAEVDKLISEIV